MSLGGSLAGSLAASIGGGLAGGGGIAGALGGTPLFDWRGAFPTLGAPPDVASWTSAGTNGLTLAQASAPLRPHSVARASGQALEFGSGKYMDGTAGADFLPAGGYATIWVVAAFGAGATQATVETGDTAGVSNRGLSLFTAAGSITARGIVNSSQYDASATAPGTDVGVYMVSGHSGGVTLGVDGVETHNIFASSGLNFGQDRVTVGQLDAGVYGFNGDIYRIIAASGAIDAETRQAVTTLLMEEYGI